MRSLRWLIPALVLVALASSSQNAQAIVDGTTVPIADHPYQARVVMTAPSGRTYSCGGVIYDSTHVITAAHCAYIERTLLAPSKFAVGTGSADRSNLTTSTVSEATIPKAYLSDGSYDVALLTLTAPLTFSASVAPIPLASAATLTAGINAPEAPTFATGWGDVAEGVNPPDNLLRGVSLPLRADNVCSTFYAPSYMSPRSVCAGGKQAGPDAPDTCQGDSGGPLALGSVGSYELVGLTSEGLGCGRPFTPAIYTETSSPPIKAVIEGTAAPADTYRGSEWTPPSSGGGGGAPPVTIPPSQAPSPPPPSASVSRDIARPTARLSSVSCKRKGRCSFRFKVADAGGVKALSASVARKIRRCRTRGSYRYCNTYTRRKVLKPKRVTGGFTISATLAKAKYTLSAVATDTSGNRSLKLTKTFTVRR